MSPPIARPALIFGPHLPGRTSSAVAEMGQGHRVARMTRRTQLFALLTLAALLRSASAPAVEPCVGDCRGTGREDIGSLVTLVSIALGNAPPSACPFGVPDGAQVTIALLIQAVDNALGACAAAPTPTPSAAASGTPTPTVTPNGTCPPGQHRACHSGSGRGGGYHRICTCVANPPPVCRTASGTQIAAGATVLLYDTTTVTAPDTCAAHATQVSCSADGVLTPANATGYTVCTVVGGDDD